MDKESKLLWSTLSSRRSINRDFWQMVIAWLKETEQKMALEQLSLSPCGDRTGSDFHTYRKTRTICKWRTFICSKSKRIQVPKESSKRLTLIHLWLYSTLTLAVSGPRAPRAAAIGRAFASRTDGAEWKTVLPTRHNTGEIQQETI